MGTFGLNGFGQIDDKAQLKMMYARRLAAQVALGPSRQRSAPPFDIVAQIERLMGEAIGLYESAGMSDKAAQARAEADRLAQEVQGMIRNMSRVRGGSRGGTMSLRPHGSRWFPRGRMGAFGSLGAGASTHERKVSGAINRAREAQMHAMRSSSITDFLIFFSAAMQAYGEAIAHQGSVMGRVTEVNRLMSQAEVASVTMQDYGLILSMRGVRGARRSA